MGRTYPRTLRKTASLRSTSEEEEEEAYEALVLRVLGGVHRLALWDVIAAAAAWLAAAELPAEGLFGAVVAADC